MPPPPPPSSPPPPAVAPPCSSPTRSLLRLWLPPAPSPPVLAQIQIQIGLEVIGLRWRPRTSPQPEAAAAAQRILAARTKIIGVGRNYVAHVKEFGNLVPKEPVLFLKPTLSFLHAGVATAAVEIPEPLESLHHEVELAVVISRRGRDIPEASAMDFIGGSSWRCLVAHHVDNKPIEFLEMKS